MLLDPAPMDVRMDFIQKNVRRDVVRRVHRLATGNPGNARVPVQMVCMVIIAISPAIEPAKMDAVKPMVYVLLDALTGNLEPTVSRLVVVGVFLGVTNSMGIVFAKKAGKLFFDNETPAKSLNDRLICIVFFNTECSQTRHGQECEKQCSPTCLNGTCFSNNGSCKDVFDSNVNNDKTSPAINQASASITNTEVYPVLYGVITVLIMSVILNIFLIVRNIRQRRYNTPDLNRDHNHANSTIDASSTIHERTEDNTNYEERRQSSGPPLYEELKCI
ncbi:uncharacterized protein LOC134283606 [Saccostrea cucullata]|uniref:uncharacterized protein LOC134283606 n=1 Tax=Saccostrea cuccullata TaxID=36930 RepID=UPI002ED0FB52